VDVEKQAGHMEYMLNGHLKGQHMEYLLGQLRNRVQKKNVFVPKKSVRIPFSGSSEIF
jgi:hypothetical protein